MTDAQLLTELQDIVTRLARIEALIGKPMAQAFAAPVGGDVATDEDLDGRFGNEPIKKDPKRWTGPSYVGCRLSECPADYLECVASFNDWRAGMAVKEGKDPKWPKLDAARARGWKARILANPEKYAPKPEGDAAGNYDPPTDDLDPDSIPF